MMQWGKCFSPLHCFQQNTNIMIVKKYLLVFLLIFPFRWIAAQTFTVQQDGSGDFTTIQAALDSLPGNDTILVWPGTYYENLSVKNKNFILGSLVLTTGDYSYTYQTIIDGGHKSSCLYIHQSNYLEINGFTLTHGSGFPTSGGAGGIWFEYSNGKILNCIIKKNEVNGGAGGVAISVSNVFLSNTSIFKNKAKESGGGILISPNSSVVFDSINRCSIYMNYSTLGTDLVKMLGDTLRLFLDTSTVNYYDPYYLASIDYLYGYPQNDILLDARYAILETDTSDLYVSPSGDNSNSGTSLSEPLKNIWYAFLKAAPGPANRQNIFLMPGIYSKSTNNEWLPIGCRDYTNLIGISPDSTIIDAENLGCHFYSKALTQDFNLENISLINGDGDTVNYMMETGSIFLLHNRNVVIKNVSFRNNKNISCNSIRFKECDNMRIENCNILTGFGGPIRFSAYGDSSDTLNFSRSDNTIINCKIKNNRPDIESEYGWGTFFAFIAANPDIDTLNVDMIGCQFTNGVDNTIYGYNVRGTLSFLDVNTNIVNCTFADNKAAKSQAGASINFSKNSEVNIYNTVFYNNEPLEIGLYKDFYPPYLYPDVHFYHSLVQGGESSFYLSHSDITYYYDSTNIDTDPLFYGGPDFPYNLSAESPCIDAGTLDLPQFILDNMPDTDLAGNPRIVGGKIDMGAYEWNPTVDVKENSQPKTQNSKLLVAPNPFSNHTTITAQWVKTADVDIRIYTNTGLLVKTLQSGRQLPGSCEISWDGTDENGKILPAGMYVVVMTVNGRETESIKVVKTR